MGYFSHCYRKSRGSIFVGGLVGGMFLSFLMDEDDKCADRLFTTAFFVIGILHFLANILSGAAAYASKASEADKEVTLLERKSQLVIIFLQHLVKLAQYPMVVWLGWYVVQFNSEINGSVTIFCILLITSTVQASGRTRGMAFFPKGHRSTNVRFASVTATLCTWPPWSSSFKWCMGSSPWGAWSSCGMWTARMTRRRWRRIWNGQGQRKLRLTLGREN